MSTIKLELYLNHGGRNLELEFVLLIDPVVHSALKWTKFAA
jgi:hypothetical protein